MSQKPVIPPTSVTDPITALIRPFLVPGQAAVVVTRYATPMSVVIVARADAEATWRSTATYLNENGYGPEWDVLTAMCESTTAN